MPSTKIKENFPVVISASRMCDLPKWYPQFLIKEIKKRIENGQKIHSLIIWTKHPASLLNPPVVEELIDLKTAGIQLYFQITITGMGGKICGYDQFQHPWKPEPNAPSKEESLKMLPQIITLAGHSLRIRLRIDPILQVSDANNEYYSNYKESLDTIEKCALLGIKNFSFSLVEAGIYKKVDRRFQKIGIKLLNFDEKFRLKIKQDFNNLEEELGISISACCVKGWPVSSCIDGKMLQYLHPSNLIVSLRQPHSRPLCGCTASIDIGGWPPKPCPTGCDYCYARPVYHPLLDF